MKKFFSTVLAVVAAMAINADNYYLGGINGQWPEPGSNAAYQLTGEGEVLSATFEKVNAGSELKVFIGEGWAGNEWAAAAEGDKIVPNGAAYTLAQPAIANLGIEIAEKHYLENAVVTYNTTTHEMTITGTDVDGSEIPDVFCLVGACTDNWSTSAALEFVEVEGVLTVTVPDLNGGFKIIKNHQWGWEAAANGSDALAMATPMTLVTAGGNNIGLANPFGGYHNAVLTLDVTNVDAPVLTLVSGEFAMSEAHWYLPGTFLGWNCDATTEFTPVEDKENTYEFLAAEFGKDFKVVFGVWGVEFGAPKGSEGFVWEANKEIELATPCDNLYGANDELLTDATITIVVDYENVGVKLFIESEVAEAIENSKLNGKAAKAIVGNELVIIKNGVRYNVLGARL